MIPSKITQSVLNRLALPGEVLAVVVLVTGSGLGTFVVQGRGTKTFAFQFESRRGTHVLRFPASVWMSGKAGLALELFGQQLGLVVRPVIETWDVKRSLSELVLPEVVVEPSSPPSVPSCDVPPSGEGLSAVEPLDFRVDGKDIYLGDERIGGFYEPGDHLRMTRGQLELRPALEEWLEVHHKPSEETP